MDAGDIGAGHTVTALYEVKFRRPALAAPRSPRCASATRIPAPRWRAGTSQKVEKALPTAIVRQSVEAASGPTQLSLVVALFAEKLRGSYWARNVPYEDLLRLWKQLPEPIRTRDDAGDCADSSSRPGSTTSAGTSSRR